MTLGFLVSGGKEFYPGPVTRLDCSELLCNKVLLKYKREKASDIDIRRGHEECPACLASVSKGVTYYYLVIPVNQKTVWRL